MIIELAKSKDKPNIAKLDCHISPSRLGACICNGQVYILKDDHIKNGGQDHRLKAPVVGVLRYSLFWQTIPFLDLLYLDDAYRRQGFGTQMMHDWEVEMKKRGHKYVMTSTQADESAWRFYEKLGYHKVGGFLPPEQEAEEWIYLKQLKLTEEG